MKAFLRRGYRYAISLLRWRKLLYGKLLDLGYTLNFFSAKQIPVIINNFNRLTYPLALIRFLEECGYTNIVILDNNSTYPPLLEFYKTCKHKVIRKTKNYGHLALWTSGLYHAYKWNYFIYTDADILPVESCPKDFIHYLRKILRHNPKLDKVGFGIKIDDLPDTFSLKEKVVNYEKQYWANEAQPNLYDAPIDTTFALYRPFSNLNAGQVFTLRAFRTGFPFLIRHLPWYMDCNNLSEEEIYYRQTSNASSSLSKQMAGKEVVY